MSSRSSPANIVGIELGVTCNYAGHLSASGEPMLLLNGENEISTRSAIWFESSGKVIVGTEAWKMRGLNDHVFLEFLRDIGTGATYPTPNGLFSPSDLCALLLQKITKEMADEHRDVSALAITVPTSLTDWARNDILRAAVMAGIRDFRLVDVATALALSTHRRHQLKDGKYLILCSGISSTDAIAFEVIGNDVSVLYSSGVARLGFTDFRYKFADLINRKYARITGIESSQQEMLAECGLTCFDLEEGIKNLGSRTRIAIPLKTVHGCLRCDISREEFVEAVRPLTTQVELLVDTVLEAARISPEKLSRGFLQAQPEIRAHLADTLTSLTGAYPSEVPEGAAALGATIYAAMSAGSKLLTDAQKTGLALTHIQNLAPSFLGMIQFDRLNYQRLNRIIIPKGEPLPACRSIELTVDESGWIPEITLTESGTAQEDPDFVNHVRTLAASRAKPGSRHTLTIGFDENGCAYANLICRDDGGDTTGFMELPSRRRN